MAIKFANRVKVVTTTTGTGTITLGSAVAGFQTFADGGILNGNSVRYTILDGDAWEVGVGVYSSTGPTMTRTLDESSTGSLLNLSGDCEVFITTSAADIENLGSRSIDQFQFTATSSQTIFTGNDDNANQLAFFEDNILVTLNGAVLELTADYTVSGGNTITLTAGATAGDELNVVAFKSFTIADAVPTTGGAFTGNVDFGAGIDVTGNITVTGTVDGRDVAADGTKLDGIESGATADQTASEILTAIKTVDGTGSGLDADLLDGQQGSYYTGYTDTAIANLVDTAPATLDTLNELAAALGDDPNFATTVTNALATKAPIASPTFTGTATADAFAGDGSALTGIVSIPAGAILLWSGSIASIPSGWVLCDGLNGTPNLQDRFVVGAGSSYAVAATGGASTVTLATTEIPSHTHSFSANATSGAGGAHTPAGSIGGGGAHTPAGNISNVGNHTHNGSTSNTGAHTHTLTKYYAWGYQNVPGGSSDYSNPANNTTSSAGAHSHNFTTAGSGAHGHTFTGTAVGNHTHTFTGTAVGNHTHSVAVSGTTGATGGAGAHENKPPYYALAYIMKT